MLLIGTAAYWNSSRSDLIAMINSLPSLPTWFVTLSSRDLAWTDLLFALLKTKHTSDPFFDGDSSKVCDLSFKERSQLLADFPVVAARHFDHRFRAFLNYIKADDKVLGGKVIHHWFRIEFQARGSPHVHMLIWVQNAPSFDSPEGRFLIIVIVVTISIYNIDRHLLRHRFHRENCFVRNS